MEDDIVEYSVLMSVYYKEKPDWLRMSIESMMRQTVQTNDFVLVEDGPLTRELDDVIKEYENEYSDVFNIVRLQKNLGLGLALAEGIKHCKNEYVIRMDSDDYSVPQRCEKLLHKIIEDDTLSIVGSFEVEFENEIENKVAIHKVPESSEQIYEFMKRRCALLHPTVLYKKSAVLKAGNYRNVVLYEDYDLFMRMVETCGYKGYNLQENLYYIRINDDFFKRRGGWSYLKTAVSFKYSQYKKGNMNFSDFIVSAGGQAVVCLMPNQMRKNFYLRFLR